MVEVRIFVPADGGDHSFDGVDYVFSEMPRVGEMIRFTDFRAYDVFVTTVGHIQDEDRFIAAVWTERRDDHDVESWIASYQPGR